jgi:hypothetical protein
LRYVQALRIKPAREIHNQHPFKTGAVPQDRSLTFAELSTRLARQSSVRALTLLLALRR